MDGISDGIKDGKTEGVVEGTIDGVIEGTAEGKTEGFMEGTAETEGVVEGDAEGNSDGDTVGVMEGTAVGTETKDATAAHTSSGTVLSFLPFLLGLVLERVLVDKRPLAPAVKTNCGQRQMLTLTVVLLMEAIPPGAMMISSAISSSITASGQVPSDTPTVATSTVALKELKC
jgi:hypothetical protein